MKIHAAHAAPTEAKARIMYIPEGTHAICPSVDGKPGSVVSKVAPDRGETLAAMLNTSLDQRKANNIRPTFDFDHKEEGPASAIPQSFSYEPGKGIMVDVEWTGAGRAAIEGKDYSYFSPVYQIDLTSGEPIGLPDVGPLGALVNEPAFREIERIAAKAAKSNQHSKTMSNEVLVKAGLLTEAESKTDKVAEIAASNIATLQAKAAKADKLEEDVKTLKASLKSVTSKSVDTILEAAVKAGRIAAKDESTKGFWRDQLTAAASDEDKLATVTAALNAIKPASDDLTQKVVELKASAKQPTDQTARIEAAKVKARAELGATAGFQAIWDKANQIDPAAFTAED